MNRSSLTNPLTSRALLGALLFALALGAPAARANIGEVSGFGSRTAALGGAGVAEGAGAFAATSNPAALVPRDGKRLRIAAGLLLLVPDFLPINNVVIENNYVSDKSTDRIGNVSTDYRSTFGQLLGISYTLLPESNHLTLGLTAFVPLEQLAYVDSGEAFYPEYFLHRSRTQRPQFDFALAMDLSEGLSFGAGVHLAFSLTANGSVFLQNDSSKPSSMRLGSSLTPKLSPFLGLHLHPSREFSLGAVVRFPTRSAADVNFKSGVRLTGFLPALDVNFQGTSALFYDPLSIEGGLSWEYTPSLRLYAQLDYQAWSQYETSALRVANPTIDNCQGCGAGFTVSPSRNPSFEFRDIVVPRVGHEIELSDSTIRAGYSYRPSVMKNLPNGAGNYLDPDRHIFTAGLGFRFGTLLGHELPWTLDLHGAYHHLVTETITKTAGNEVGDTSSAKIGSPGYQAGGKIWGGGVSLGLAL